MDERHGRPRERGRARRGYPARPTHRHPLYAGGQAHRAHRYGPYVAGFVVVVLALAVFLYIGLNWATGPGRAAALAVPAMSTPLPAAAPTEPPPPPPEASATPAEHVYVVKAGDSPASIAQQFHVKTEDLMAANNIDNPQKLQIGQSLKIPSPPR